jgi:diguanylate cyclase (GGDEF)-like protein/PAS domain S-box-containing protein
MGSSRPSGTTSRKQLQKELEDSELRFRRLFEAAQDGILLLDADTGQITEVNPFLVGLLGYSRSELLGKTLWEIGPFKDTEASQSAFRTLQDKEYIRYENLPLETRTGQFVNAEFVSNVYQVDHKRVIQCNIRDVTARMQAEEALRHAHEKLTDRVKELEQRHREITLLNDMGDLLQACLTLEDAYTVVTRFAPQLFVTKPGLLGILNVSKNLVDPIVTWGEPATTPAAPPFAVDDCWALRRGRLHLVEDTPTALLCKHSSPSPTPSLCIPLSAQNETIGLLHLREPSATPARSIEWTQQLAGMFARHIELALANLRLRATLRDQSIRDPLTGLFNRRYMEESLAREVSRAIRSGDPLGIIMLDLDHFKDFNDNFGHEAGDVLLRELGKLLQTHIRAGDIVCRYGGEEFIGIVTGASLETTLRRAEELRELVKHLCVEYQGRWVGPITISLGVSIFPLNGSSAETVLRAADGALYRAKGEGRDRVVAAQ